MTHYTYDRVLEDVRTVEDTRLFASEIDMLLVSLYKADTSIFLTTLNTKLHRNLTDALTLSLNEQGISLDNHEQLEQYFSDLKGYVMHLPVLQLTLAYHPTNDHLLALSDWVRQETKQPVMLEVHVNPELLGGAIVTFNGKYTDLSLRKRLEAVYETKREEVMRMIS